MFKKTVILLLSFFVLNFGIVSAQENEPDEIEYVVTYNDRFGSEYDETFKIGDMIIFNISKNASIEIKPMIYPEYNPNTGGIFYWYCWYDSLNPNRTDEEFQIGDQIDKLYLKKLSDERIGNAYYGVNIEGERFSGRPSHGWGTKVYENKHDGTGLDGKSYVYVDVVQENLKEIEVATIFDDIMENPEDYKLYELFDSEETAIEYLEEEYGITEVISDSDYYFPYGAYVNFKLKDGTTFSNEEGAINTFVWSINIYDIDYIFADCYWTNTNNIPLSGELVIQNPVSNNVEEKPTLPVCAGEKDKNCDGVVTCEEEKGAGWTWNNSTKVCEFTVGKEYVVVNTASK